MTHKNLATDETGESRFRMLETLCEFGLEQLEASGEENDVRRHHAAHFLKWVTPMSEASYIEVISGAWLNGADMELHNLRSVWVCSLEHEPETCLQLSSDFNVYWHGRNKPCCTVILH